MAERIAVIGAGLMGHGIAQIFAAAGHPVALHDSFAKLLESAPSRIAALFDLLGQDPAALANISYHPGFEDAVSNADFVFEAAPEKPEVKQAIFERLGRAARPDAVLCTNTSA